MFAEKTDVTSVLLQQERLAYQEQLTKPGWAVAYLVGAENQKK